MAEVEIRIDDVLILAILAALETAGADYLAAKLESVLETNGVLAACGGKN